MAEEWTIKTGAELRQRMQASGQTLEHSREKGWHLSQTHERVSPLAVAEERIRLDRMRKELKVDAPRLSRSW